jgi:hypothetical protein
MPFVGLQDAHTQTWWWMEFLTSSRTLFLARQPTWQGWVEALRNNWIVGVRHDATNGFKTQLAGGSNVVREHVMNRQSQWRWWGEESSQMNRPWASLVGLTPEDIFEEAHPQDGVTLRLRCLWDTEPSGVPKKQVVDLVSSEIDGNKVEPQLVHLPSERAFRGDTYHQWQIYGDKKGRHTAVATLRNNKDRGNVQSHQTIYNLTSL